MQLWFFLSILAAVFWAIGLIFIKKGLSNLSPLWSNIITYLVRLPIWLPVVLILSKFKINAPTFEVVLAITVACGLNLTMTYALAKSQVSLSGTLISLYPVSTLILSLLFLNEQISLFQLGGIIIVLTGSLLLALPKKVNSQALKNLSWFWLGLISAVCIGIGDFLLKISTNEIGGNSNAFYMSFISLILCGITWVFDRKGREIPKFKKETLLPTIIGSGVTMVGSLIFFLAFEFGNLSLIAPVAASYPALMVILAVIFLKDKLDVRQIIGIFLALLGVFAIGVF